HLSWALDALAIAPLQATDAAMGTLAAMKTFAAKHDDPRLWDAWAAAVATVGGRLYAPSDRLFQELEDRLHAHGTPDLRLAWANGVASPTDARPLERQQQIVAQIRALADRHDDEPRLRVAWARGVWGLLRMPTAVLAHAARNLDDLKTCASATDDAE